MRASAHRIILNVLAAAALASMSACRDPVSACVDICWTSGIVYGRAQDASGAPIAGVRLGFIALQADCDLDDLRSLVGEAVTKSDGRFRATLSSLFSPFTAECVTVSPNPANGWEDDAQFFPVSLEMRFEGNNPTPRDSVELIVTLQ